MPEYNFLRPDADKHQKAIETVKDIVIEYDGKPPSKTIAEKLEKESKSFARGKSHDDNVSKKDGWSESYCYGIVGDIRQYLLEQGWLEVETVREGGNPTYYWEGENNG